MCVQRRLRHRLEPLETVTAAAVGFKDDEDGIAIRDRDKGSSTRVA